MNKINGQWYFPPGNPGDKQGFKDSGMSHFNDDYALHTARETIQNVIDARDNTYQPATVKFKRMTVKTRDAIPQLDHYKNIISELIKSNTKEGKDFFKKSLKILNSEDIEILIISDYNTKGITGVTSNKDYTRWDNLIMRRGSSEAQGAAGGTYGIGKHAPFGCSFLRTIFYYTETVDNEIGYIWNSIFTTHGDPIKSPRGKFCNNKETMSAFTDKTLRPSFIDRSSTGTDLCILGLDIDDSDDELWNIKFQNKIMDSYFVAIFDNELVIQFEDDKHKYEINNENIYDFMQRAYLKNKKNNFPLLDGYAKSDHIFSDTLKHLGKCSLHIKLNDKYDRTVGFMRKPKMLVYIKPYIRLNKGYSAVFICKDSKGNNFLKKLEGVTHSDWSAERYKNDLTKARSAIHIIGVFINEQLSNLKSDIFKNETIIEGLEHLLGYNDKEINDNKIEESIEIEDSRTTPWEELESKPTKLMKTKNTKQRKRDGTRDSGDEEGKGFGGAGYNGGGGGTIPGNKGFGDLEGGSPGDYKFKINKNKYSFKCFKHSKSDSYTFKLKGSDDINTCNISFFSRGLDSDTNEGLEIISAVDNAGSDLKFVDNKIIDFNISNKFDTIVVAFKTTNKQSVNIEIYG